MAEDRIELRLYVAGEAPNSLLARRNLRELCAALPADRYRLEIVDVLREPERALAEGILLTPTLLRLAPAPRRRIIGNLGDRQAALLALELEEGE